VEANCHFLEFPALGRGRNGPLCQTSEAVNPSSGPFVGAPEEPTARREECGGRVELRAVKSLDTGCQRFARQVPLYCFRLGKCGTFMPLQGIRGEFRIAVVWTLFVLVFSSLSSVHFSILFTRAVALSAIDCR
jgi:hypothetical protein